MRSRNCYILVLLAGLCVAPALAQSDFDSSLHKTRAGKDFWYGSENGGFEQFTNVPIEELGCTDCHGPTDANGDLYEPWEGSDCKDCHATASDWSVSEDQCLGCHGRQSREAALGFTDVHREMGMPCWTCHGSGDIHGDGTEYDSMLQPGAIDVDCEDCHDESGVALPEDHPDYDPHDGKLHCTACHSKSVITCYNCHFESQVESHVKRAKQVLSDYVLLVNRDKDGKVYTGTFQSLTYQGTAFVAFAPYTAHTTVAEGRGCPDCHYNFGEQNEAIRQYNENGEIRFAEWDDDAKTLSWVHGVVPMPEDYQQTFKMDFITYDGETSDPPGPSSNWSSIGKDTWDGSQMFFATPMTRSQMTALGFEIQEPMPDIAFDIKPGSCPNSVGVNSQGKLPAALLGGSDFDVRDVDVSSLALEGVPVMKYSYDDVAAPCEGGCCLGDSFDGYEDLNLKFDTPSILEAIGDWSSGDEIELTLTGSMLDGTSFEARDTIVLRGNPNWRWDRGRSGKVRAFSSRRER